MGFLSVRFVIRLGDKEKHGPAFHRWLPDGEQDSIYLNTYDKEIELKVWFKRYGYSDETKPGITFSLEKNDVDPLLIGRNGLLYSGPLFGEVKIDLKKLNKEEVEFLQQICNCKDQLNIARNSLPLYKKIGRKVITFIHQPTERFIDVIRTVYGQYWIPPFPVLDENKENVGNYCQLLNMTWKLTGDSFWKKFSPEIPTIILKGHRSADRDFKHLLDKNDWWNLTGKLDTPISFAAKILIEARHQYEINHNPSYGFVLGVSGLELSVEEIISYKHKKKEKEWITQLNYRAKQKYGIVFNDLSLGKKVKVLGFLVPHLSNWTKPCSDAVYLRNSIVHDGKTIKNIDQYEDLFHGLINFSGRLLPNPFLKYPLKLGNTVVLKESNWDKD
jgi:hypothetical protein